SYVPKAACRRCLSASRLRRESHSRTPYPSAKPAIRVIAVSSIESPPIREPEAMIKGHQTYMNLTAAFFKRMFKQCCEKGTREGRRCPNSDLLARERERGLIPGSMTLRSAFSPVNRRGFSFVEPIPALGVVANAELSEVIPHCTLVKLGPASAGPFLVRATSGTPGVAPATHSALFMRERKEWKSRARIQPKVKRTLAFGHGFRGNRHDRKLDSALMWRRVHNRTSDHGGKPIRLA